MQRWNTEFQMSKHVIISVSHYIFQGSYFMFSMWFRSFQLNSYSRRQCQHQFVKNPLFASVGPNVSCVTKEVTEKGKKEKGEVTLWMLHRPCWKGSGERHHADDINWRLLPSQNINNFFKDGTRTHCLTDMHALSCHLMFLLHKPVALPVLFGRFARIHGFLTFWRWRREHLSVSCELIDFWILTSTNVHWLVVRARCPINKF